LQIGDGQEELELKIGARDIQENVTNVGVITIQVLVVVHGVKDIPENVVIVGAHVIQKNAITNQSKYSQLRILGERSEL
jgi:hypothetical protein